MKSCGVLGVAAGSGSVPGRVQSSPVPNLKNFR